MRMLGRLLGVPDEDGPWLVERGDALLGNTDPEFTTHPVGLVDTDEFRLMPFRSPAGIELFRYAQEQAQQRRAHPTDDVISDLLAPKVDGELLTEHEFNNFFTLLVAAGNDTTRYTMTAGMKALIEHPDQLAEPRLDGGDAELMDTAVEEILRWGTVTMHFRRTATTTPSSPAGHRGRRQGRHLVHLGRLRRRRVRRSVPVRHPPLARTSTSPSVDEPAPVPRRPAGPHGDQGAGGAARLAYLTSEGTVWASGFELPSREESTGSGWARGRTRPAAGPYWSRPASTSATCGRTRRRYQSEIRSPGPQKSTPMAHAATQTVRLRFTNEKAHSGRRRVEQCPDAQPIGIAASSTLATTSSEDIASVAAFAALSWTGRGQLGEDALRAVTSVSVRYDASGRRRRADGWGLLDAAPPGPAS